MPRPTARRRGPIGRAITDNHRTNELNCRKNTQSPPPESTRARRSARRDACTSRGRSSRDRIFARRIARLSGPAKRVASDHGAARRNNDAAISTGVRPSLLEQHGRPRRTSPDVRSGPSFDLTLRTPSVMSAPRSWTGPHPRRSGPWVATCLGDRRSPQGRQEAVPSIRTAAQGSHGCYEGERRSSTPGQPPQVAAGCQVTVSRAHS